MVLLVSPEICWVGEALELATKVDAEMVAGVPALQLPIVPGLPAEPVAEIQKAMEVRAKVFD